MMTIITQESELVNYNSLTRISTFSGEVEDTECFAIIGFPVDSKIEDDVTDGVIHLGIYNSEEECAEVINKFIEAIESEQKIFRMPDPVVVS